MTKLAMKRKFARSNFACFAIRIGRSRDRTEHRWGRRMPEGHSCKSAREEFSDYETEDEDRIHRDMD